MISRFTMEGLKTIINKAPIVLLFNAFDPYCLQAQTTLDSFRFPKTLYTKVLIDEVENSGEVEAASVSLAKDEPLPHLYINSKFYCAGEQLEKLRAQKTLKYDLIDAGALPKPKMDKLEELIKKTKFVAIVNSYSPYCFSALEIIQLYELGSDEAVVNLLYVDKTSDGDQLEQAALYKSKCANLPVVFINGQSLGSLDELKAMHENTTLEQKLVDAGVFKQPAVAKLQQLKTSAPVVVLKNSFSAYCLNVEDILDGLNLGGNLKYVDLEKEDGEDLQRAARLETRAKEAPYIYIAGSFIATIKFLAMSKDNTLKDTLAKAGAN